MQHFSCIEIHIPTYLKGAFQETELKFVVILTIQLFFQM